MNTKLLFPLLITVLALLGIMDAGFITYSEVTGNFPPCRPPFACRAVLDSSWAKIGPIPLYALGLLYYSVLFILGVLVVTEKHFSLKKRVLHFPKILSVIGILGGAFSLWLLFVMGVILKAWCLYCLFSAINCLIIFILSKATRRSYSANSLQSN